MISFLLLMFANLTAQVGDGYFNPQFPSVVRVQSNSFTYDYDTTLSSHEAAALFQYFNGKCGESRIGSYYRLPKTQFYLAAVQIPKDTLGEGFRIVLADLRADSVIELFQSKGTGDSWFLRPTFFFNGQELIILAEYGEEHTEGFITLKYSNDRMTQLCNSELSALDSQNNYSSPTKNIRVRNSDGTYYLEFMSDVIMHPVTNREEIIRQSGSCPIIFHFNGQDFIQDK
jgi:hypothetical protein